MPKLGHFILRSHALPAITAGRYVLKTEQIDTPFPVAPEQTHVHVAAPRYTMPTEQILSSFPPANAEGAFGDRLPQIVLKRRTLPWERNPAGGPDPSPTPWLALVVVAEGEAQLSPATKPVAECVTPGTMLHEPSDKDVEQGLYLAVTETVVKKIFPTQDDLPLLTHVREVDVNDTELANGDDDGFLAVVLANRVPVYDHAAGKPVRYMACLVNVEGQLAALPKPTPPVDRFTWELAQDWSVLAGVGTQVHADAMVMNQATVDKSRLPSKFGLGGAAANLAGSAVTQAMPKAVGAPALDGGQALVQAPVSGQWLAATQAVSTAALGSDAQRMVRDTMGMGFRFPIEVYAQEKVLRFPVLAHWSFTTSEGATFEKLMQGLDVGLLGTLPAVPKPDPTRPEPPPRPQEAEPEVVTTGHIGLGHRTRRGDPMKAWYRGPAVPFATARDGQGSNKPLPLAHSADQLRRVIPDGREDLALAAAFEIGRLLALSQLSVVSALMRFRGEQFGVGRVREVMAQLMPFKLPTPKANDGLGKVDMGRFVAVQVLDVLSRNSERMLGPQRPVADPGRPLKVEGDIDKLIAEGLGLDHGQLVKRSADIGLLAALQQTPAPAAGLLGASKFGESEQLALQGALTSELNRTLKVAAPPLVGRPGARPGRGVAAAAAQRDALDELIERAAEGQEDDES